MSSRASLQGCHPERSVSRHAPRHGAEGPALKIHHCHCPENKSHRLPWHCHPEAQPKDPQLHFHDSGRNTVPSMTALKIHHCHCPENKSHRLPWHCHPEAQPKDPQLHFHDSGRNTVPSMTALKIHHRHCPVNKSHRLPWHCHPEAQPKDPQLHFHASCWNTVPSLTAVALQRTSQTPTRSMLVLRLYLTRRPCPLFVRLQFEEIPGCKFPYVCSPPCLQSHRYSAPPSFAPMMTTKSLPPSPINPRRKPLPAKSPRPAASRPAVSTSPTTP